MMDTIADSVANVGEGVAYLGSRISGNVEIVVMQADVKLLHDKTETAERQAIQTAPSSKTQT